MTPLRASMDKYIFAAARTIFFLAFIWGTMILLGGVSKLFHNWN